MIGKWLTLALFAYVAVILSVSIPWRRAIDESLRPWLFFPPGVSLKEYAAMGFFDVGPIKALVWSAVVNGVISVPIMVVMMLVGQSTRLTGRYTISPRHRFLAGPRRRSWPLRWR